MSKNGVALETIADMAYVALPKVRKGLEMEQSLEAYPAVEEMLPWVNDEGVSNLSFEEQIQLRQPVGSVVKHKPYAEHNPVFGSYVAKQKMSIAVRKEISLTLDMVEDGLSGEKDPETKLFALLSENRIPARERALHDAMENELLGVPEEAGEENGFFGFRYWAGMSCDSSGNYVAAPTPAYQFTRTRFANGTATTLFGERQIDASLLANENYRALGWTHEKEVDEYFLKRFAESLEKQSFSRIKKLKGRLQSPEWMVLFPSSMHAQVRDIANTQGADDGDVYKRRTAKIFGEVIKRSDVLEADVSKPCLVINKNAFKIKKAKNMWMVDLPKKRIGDTAWSYPMLYTMQGFASSRRRLGFVCHGSW